MSTHVCGHVWTDHENTAMHQQHVCGEETDGSDHVHLCAGLMCGATK